MCTCYERFTMSTHLNLPKACFRWALNNCRRLQKIVSPILFEHSLNRHEPKVDPYSIMHCLLKLLKYLVSYFHVLKSIWYWDNQNTEWSRKNRTDSRHHSYGSEWAKCLKFRFCTPQHMHFSILSGICHMCIFTYIFSHGLKICIFQKSDTNLSLKTWQNSQIATNYTFDTSKSWNPA